MINAQVNAPFEALLLGAPAGLSDVEIEVYDPTDGAAVVAASSDDISEPRPGTYRAARSVTAAGTFVVRWTWAGSDGPESADEELVVRIGSPPPPTADPADRYFEVSELRATHPDLADDEAYPDDDLDAARAGAEEMLEHACRVAFVVRQSTEVVQVDATAGGPHTVFVGCSRLRAVISASSAGVALNLVGVVVLGSCRLFRPAGWPLGPLEVTYQHGLDRPPARIRLAAMELARALVVPDELDARVVRVATGDGDVLTLAGSRDGGFGIPSVDSAVAAHREIVRNPFGL